jgi:hypothetical protein
VKLKVVLLQLKLALGFVLSSEVSSRKTAAGFCVANRALIDTFIGLGLGERGCASVEFFCLSH